MLINHARAQRLMAEQELEALLFHDIGGSLTTRPFSAVVFADTALDPFVVVPSVDFRLAKHIGEIQDVRAYVRAEKASDRDSEFYPDFFSALHGGLQDRKATHIRLGYEENLLPAPRFEELRTSLSDCTLVPASELVARIKAVKTAAEIAHLRRAAEITVRAHESFRQAIALGITERDLALVAQFTMLREGAERIGFMYIGSNETRGFTHNPFPTDVPLKRGDFVKVDMGCSYQGYESDFARSYILGKATDQQKEVYKALDDGCKVMGEGLTPGRSCIDIFNSGFKFMTGRLPGYAREFLGHGIGRNTHEEPRLHEGNPMILEPGMVMCIEHTFYLDGARYHFEDTFLIEVSGPVCWTSPLDRGLEVAV